MIEIHMYVSDGSYMELLQSQWIHIMPTTAGAVGTIADSKRFSST